MKSKSKTLATAFIVLTLSACANMSAEKVARLSVAVSEADMIPVKNPIAVQTIEVYDKAQKKRIEADVLALESKTIRRRLTSTRTFISVEKRDSSGGFSYVGAGGKVSKGTYRVTFDYTNYMNRDIDINETTTAIGRVGVGLRVTATLDTSSKEVDVSGLLPIGLAAKDNKVSGQIEYYVYGMSNDKISVAAPSPKTLDLSSIQEAFEASAKTKVMFNLDETVLEPYLIGLAKVDSKDAQEVSKIATEKLSKKAQP
ncbi:hypothetical protein [Thalassotalea montiporae]